MESYEGIEIGWDILDELLKEYEGIDIEDAKNDINEFLAGLKNRGIYE